MLGALVTNLCLDNLSLSELLPRWSPLHLDSRIYGCFGRPYDHGGTESVVSDVLSASTTDCTEVSSPVVRAQLSPEIPVPCETGWSRKYLMSRLTRMTATPFWRTKDESETYPATLKMQNHLIVTPRTSLCCEDQTQGRYAHIVHKSPRF
jgi:hypothetical protein